MSARRALLIALNYKSTKFPLAGCINDQRNLTEHFLHHKAFRLEEMITMHDERDAGSDALFPSLNNVTAQLDSLVSLSRKHPQLSLFLAFSGHGYQTPDFNQDEQDTKDEVMVLADGILRDDVLLKNFIRRLHSGVILTVLMDCCHSGSLLDLPYNLTQGSIQENHKTEVGALITMLSGCSDAGTSSDATFNGQAQGAMTGAFVQTWIPGMTWGTLLKQLRQYLTLRQFYQVPQLTSSNVDLGLSSLVKIGNA